MDKPQEMNRRGFLDWVVGFFSCVSGAALTVPALMYLWPAAKGNGADRVEVEGAESLQVGQAKTVQVGGKAVIVVRQRSAFKAFSASCTHLGCLVRWESAAGRFKCPCHAAVFDKDGNVVSGPPPGPLPEYQIKEVGGKVFVSAKA
ncbi:MAG: ubiquinol-cytochrome c reductase iron-sulfur subunit [Phycisphaerae bacterium]